MAVHAPEPEHVVADMARYVFIMCIMRLASPAVEAAFSRFSVFFSSKIWPMSWLNNLITLSSRSFPPKNRVSTL